jgi:hypothetical protein
MGPALTNIQSEYCSGVVVAEPKQKLRQIDEGGRPIVEDSKAAIVATGTSSDDAPFRCQPLQIPEDYNDGIPKGRRFARLTSCKFSADEGCEVQLAVVFHIDGFCGGPSRVGKQSDEGE